MHLVIDGYTGNHSLLQDQEHVRQFLDSFPDRIGMTKIITPQVLTYNGPVPEDWGVSGFVIIAESHISVHTFPDRSFVQVDVFSCKDFDTDLALQDVKECFDAARRQHLGARARPRPLQPRAGPPRPGRRSVKAEYAGLGDDVGPVPRRLGPPVELSCASAGAVRP